ncbi:hypothetical protein N7468_005543 [Penicillium chermesinum]|uniref:Rhodopsin domain-containing protein n=1 Tax=Penicillium chermesinum TaxID=63820 RepID=A0A9W9P1U5_9EURO|nr:uncharacterized protein N7468_005543 [Penicillium chermesinum]KAJ5232587.1 hypothetical protein N7468_005543 [Penicillium chermesinum]
MGLDIPDGTPNRGPGMMALCILLLVLTTFMTVIRVVSKVITKQSWWWDDWFALLSWPAEVVVISLLLAWITLGFGLHEKFIAIQNPSYLVQGAKYFYAAVLFFDTSICLPKISALFFYARVFNAPNKTLRVHLWILGALVAGWLLSAYFVTIWQCDPVAKAWDPTIPGKCVNTYAWYTATATISCAIDMWILIIPIPLIWRLNSSLRRRIYLLAAFLLTYSVIVVSIGRMIATTQLIPKVNEDETWWLPVYLYWAILEGSLSIISISVPNAIALVKHFQAPRKSSIESKTKLSKLTPGYVLSQSQNYASIHGGGTSISDASDNLELVQTRDGDVEMAPGNIRVKTNIHVH